jgi:hypothetical protein
MDGGQRAEIEPASDLLERRGISVLLNESRDEFEDFLLTAGNCHSGIIANKKRIVEKV